MYQPDKYISMSLETWYPKGHELHYDPLHPVIKLAGEAGELLDLYGKHKFKPGFDWWDCKHCRGKKSSHAITGSESHVQLSITTGYTNCTYTPKILDEMGDWWYYCRILMHLSEKNIEDFSFEYYANIDILFLLSWMNYCSAQTLKTYLTYDNLDIQYIHSAYKHFINLLVQLDVTLDELTEMNYLKLNSEETNHGWRDATIKAT